jgi:predicted lipase
VLLCLLTNVRLVLPRCLQAAVFAAKLLALQASGDLPAYSGDTAEQIKLYTFGAPRVGSTVFAGYLEDFMIERYR